MSPPLVRFKADRRQNTACAESETVLKKIFLMSMLLLLSTQFLVPVDAAGQAVILNNHTGYIDLTRLYRGLYHVIGEVQNTGDGALWLVKITATFYDSAGAVVATDFTFTMLWILHPGQKSPFDILLSDIAQSAKVDHYELEISYEQYESLPVGLEILSHSKYEDSIGYIHVVGEIKNIGDRDAHMVFIAATFYDSSGKVAGVAYTFSHPANLTAGQKAPFEVLLEKDPVGKRVVATYVLEAQSEEYNIIPELPLATLILPIAILLAVAVLRVRLLYKRNRVV